MVGYAYSSHRGLAPFLIKHPGLFGLYEQTSEEPQDEVCRPSAAVPELARVLSVARNSPPSCFSSQRSTIMSDFQLSLEENPLWHIDKSSLEPEKELNSVRSTEDWYFDGNEKGFGTPLRTVRRRKAMRISTINQRPLSRALDVPVSPIEGYDFTRLDQLLDDLNEQVRVCAAHIEPESRMPLVPLPRTVSEPLTKLHVYHTTNLTDILPPIPPGIRWRSSTRIFPNVRLSSDPLTGNPSDGIDREAAHFRALRTLRLHVASDKFQLVYTLMALITVESVVSHLHNLLSQAILYQASPGQLRSMTEKTQATFVHHGPQKARTVLGLSIVPQTAPRTWSRSISHEVPSSTSSTTASTHSSMTSPITPSSLNGVYQDPWSCSPPNVLGDLAVGICMQWKIQGAVPWEVLPLSSPQELDLLSREQTLALLQETLYRMVAILAKMAGVKPMTAKKIMEAKGFLATVRVPQI